MSTQRSDALSMAWITVGFPPEVSGVSLGNAERARWFGARDDLRLTVFAPAPADDELSDGPAVDVGGVKVLRYASKPLLPYPITRVPRRRAIAEIEEALEDVRPDVIINTDVERGFFLGSWGVPGLRYARRGGIPYIAHYHTDWLNFSRSYPGWRLLRRPVLQPLFGIVFRRFDGSVCATENSTAALTALVPTPVHHVPFIGVDTSIFDPSRRDRENLRAMIPDWDGTGKVVLYLGRLGREKQVNVVIEAFQKLTQDTRHRDLTLVIAGDGPAKLVKPLRELAAFSDRIHFLGFVHGDARADLYASCDVFCTASGFETFGRTVVEAMASGVPVVAPDSGAVTDYLADERNALLFPRGDRSALAQALNRALTTDMTDVVARAQELARDYSVEAGCDRLLEFYRKLLSA